MSKSGKKNKPQEEKTPEFENIGSLLRRLRNEKGLSTKDVSEITRISEVNLDAIENQDFSSLPADTFTRGFLVIYAKFLETDPAHVVSQFMKERDEKNASGKRPRGKQGRKILSPKTLAEPSHVSSITMAGLLLVFIIIAFTAFCLYTSWNPFGFLTKESDSFQSVMMNVFTDNKSGTVSDDSLSPAGLKNTEPMELPEKTDQEAQETRIDQQYIVHVTFLKNTGVTSSFDDSPVVRIEFKAGDEQIWTASRSIALTFDEPESALILLNGNPVPFPAMRNGLSSLQIPENPDRLP